MCTEEYAVLGVMGPESRALLEACKRPRFRIRQSFHVFELARACGSATAMCSRRVSASSASPVGNCTSRLTRAGFDVLERIVKRRANHSNWDWPAITRSTAAGWKWVTGTGGTIPGRGHRSVRSGSRFLRSRRQARRISSAAKPWKRNTGAAGKNSYGCAKYSRTRFSSCMTNRCIRAAKSSVYCTSGGPGHRSGKSLCFVLFFDYPRATGFGCQIEIWPARHFHSKILEQPPGIRNS